MLRKILALGANVVEEMRTKFKNTVIACNWRFWFFISALFIIFIFVHEFEVITLLLMHIWLQTHTWFPLPSNGHCYTCCFIHEFLTYNASVSSSSYAPRGHSLFAPWSLFFCLCFFFMFLLLFFKSTAAEFFTMCRVGLPFHNSRELHSRFGINYFYSLLLLLSYMKQYVWIVIIDVRAHYS